MTLTTHGIIGAATASLFPPQYRLLAWSAAFLSHFFADAIPHWDYSTQSYTRGKNPLHNDFVLSKDSVPDIIKIGIDFLLGLGLGLLLFPTFDPWLILGGAFFGILPDPLQFAYWKLRKQPLTFLQKIHIGIHAKRKLSFGFWSLFSQIMLVFCVLVGSYFFSQFLNSLIY